MPDSKDPTKHHYIPEFMLRWWTGDDGRFERYTRPIPSKIAVRRVFPSETGWMKNLYASPGDSRGEHWLETRLFQVIDNDAAPALRKLNLDPENITGEERSAWTLLLRSLAHRMPDHLRSTVASGEAIWEQTIEELRGIYPTKRGPNDPETFDEYKASRTAEGIRASVLRVLPNIMANPRLGQFLNNLHTRILTLPSGTRDFLLSDDPLMRTNGVMKPDGHIAIPISPRSLFVSTWKVEMLDQIAGMPPRELSKAVNQWQVESARYFVIGRDRSQDQFIRNRFGNDLKQPLLSPADA